LTVFDFAGIGSNNYGNFITIANPDSTAVIDTLSIVLPMTAAAAAILWDWTRSC